MVRPIPFRPPHSLTANAIRGRLSGMSREPRCSANPAKNSKTPQTLSGRCVAVLGKPAGMGRNAWASLIQEYGGEFVDDNLARADVLVVDDPIDPADQERLSATSAMADVLTTTQFWELLGLLPVDASVRKLYTPAMLSRLIETPVSTIRRWLRRGLLVPVCDVFHVPYFDFAAVNAARQLSELARSGLSLGAIERKLHELGRFHRRAARDISSGDVVVDGRELLIRQGNELIETSGQLRFDFATLEPHRPTEGQDTNAAIGPDTLKFPGHDESDSVALSPESLAQQAANLEEEGLNADAIDALRAALAAGGPRADYCFQLAELLYRLGDLTAARERYYMAIEIDENHLEARANLGCVLAELGEQELAVAAFRGALSIHSQYPDVHYHLARLLDDLGRQAEAARHWSQFIAGAPESPWADEARQRLEDACRTRGGEPDEG